MINKIRESMELTLTVSGFVGLIVGLYKYKNYLMQYSILINILLLFVICALVIKYEVFNSFKVKQLEIDDLMKVLRSRCKNFSNALIYNPNDSYKWITEINKIFFQHQMQVSYVGDTDDFIKLFSLISSDDLEKNTQSYIDSISSEDMFIFIYNDSYTQIEIFKIQSERFIHIKTIKHGINNVIKEFIKSKTQTDYGLRLKDFVNSTTLLNYLSEKKERYLNSFKELGSGKITFYGTEVLNIQSGWIENGDFKSVRTLDLTSNPGIFRDRKRYNKANDDFINKKMGSISRVYMIDEARLEETVFKKDLYDAIVMQKKIGVKVGIQYLSTLPVDYKEDFILYDNKIALVENKQASVSYDFGSSTAYFNKYIIDDLERRFVEVWTGQFMDFEPTEIANRFIEQYEREKKNEIV